ncbi:MAG: hypothetical protein U1F68_14375 [Gammaproteobacteria bacterium]
MNSKICHNAISLPDGVNRLLSAAAAQTLALLGTINDADFSATWGAAPLPGEIRQHELPEVRHSAMSSNQRTPDKLHDHTMPSSAAGQSTDWWKTWCSASTTRAGNWWVSGASPSN